jgi:6-phosphogluconolactonase
MQYPIQDSTKPPPWRISLSFKVIADARQVWVLASGAGKEDALKRSMNTEGSMSEEETPLGRVMKSRRMTKIFVDIPFRME